jgi:ABC-type sugar transport system ATPase subunit
LANVTVSGQCAVRFHCRHAQFSVLVALVKYGAREQHAALGAIERFEIRCTGPDDRLNRLSGGNQQKVVVATTGLVRRHAGNHAHD